MTLRKFIPERIKSTVMGLVAERKMRKLPTWQEVETQICEKFPFRKKSLSEILKDRNSYQCLKQEYKECINFLCGKSSAERIYIFYFQLMNVKQPQLFKTQSHVIASGFLREILDIDLSKIKTELDQKHTK